MTTKSDAGEPADVDDPSASPAETEWFEDLWSDHAGAVYAFAARRIGRDTASDVVADTFSVAWRRRSVATDLGLPWLFGVARNVIRTTNRSSMRAERRLRAAPPPTVEPSAESVVLGQQNVEDALSILTELDAEIVLLGVWEGLSSSEIGRVVGLQPGAVRMRTTRAKRALARHLRTDSNEGGIR